MQVPMAYEQQDVARKANAAIAASYRLSMNEQRILLAVLAQVRNNEPVTDQKMYFVTASDIVAEGKERGNEFHALKDACNSLFNRVVTIEGVPNGASKLPTVGPLRTRWIQSEVTYFKGKGKIGLRLSHDILPYLNQLRSDFSRIPTKPIISMTSAHAVRIFEMLMQYRDTGVCKISVIELRKRLGLEKAYRKFTDFKRRVIDISLKQINESAGIEADVEYIRKGKAVESLVFRFARDEAKKLEKKLDNAKECSDKKDNNKIDTDNKLSDLKRQAMMILVENGYEEVSISRIENIMDLYDKKNPVNAVTRLLRKNKIVTE